MLDSLWTTCVSFICCFSSASSFLHLNRRSHHSLHLVRVVHAQDADARQRHAQLLHALEIRDRALVQLLYASRRRASLTVEEHHDVL